MADVIKRFAKGYLFSTSPTTSVYKVPTNKSSIVKALTLCAYNDVVGQSTKVTLTFADVRILSEYTLKSNDTITVPFIDHILEQSEEIKITVASTGSGGAVLQYYISGREVDV